MRVQGTRSVAVADGLRTRSDCGSRGQMSRHSGSWTVCSGARVLGHETWVSDALRLTSCLSEAGPTGRGAIRRTGGAMGSRFGVHCSGVGRFGSVLGRLRAVSGPFTAAQHHTVCRGQVSVGTGASHCNGAPAGSDCQGHDIPLHTALLCTPPVIPGGGGCDWGQCAAARMSRTAGGMPHKGARRH